MTSDDDNWLICMPLALTSVVVDGSTIGRCSKCDQDVVVSPSSNALLLKRPDFVLLCLTCLGEQDMSEQKAGMAIALLELCGFGKETADESGDSGESAEEGLQAC